MADHHLVVNQNHKTMKLSTQILHLFLLCFLFVPTTQGQTKEYHTEDWYRVSYKPAEGYRKVTNLEIGTSMQSFTDYWGQVHYTAATDGRVLREVKDYYPNGGLRFKCKAISVTQLPDELLFEGPAEWYYQDGSIKEKGSFLNGKPHGEFAEYAPNGTITRKTIYQKGKAVTKNRHRGAIYTPLLGTWLYNEVKYNTPSPHITKTTQNKVTFSADGILSIQTKVDHQSNDPSMAMFCPLLGNGTFTASYNWRYVQAAGGHFLEEYDGEEMVAKSRVQWQGNNRVSFVVLHSNNPENIGRTLTYQRIR